MYHYVGIRKDLPYFRSCSESEFIYQIETLKSLDYTICSLKDYLDFEKHNKNVAILSFDDGLSDHYQSSLILNDYSSTASFYIPTNPYTKKIYLDVHKSHLIVGQLGSLSLSKLKKHLKNRNIFTDISFDKKYINTYQKHDHESDIKEFKRIVNYYSKSGSLSGVLDKILEETNLKSNLGKIYLTESQIIKMSNSGHEIGSHSCSHSLLSKLSYQEQYFELYKSKHYLENLISKKIRTFCYPYGTKISYNNKTISILEKVGYQAALSVEPKAIDLDNLKIFEIPRYDCNQFRTIFR